MNQLISSEISCHNVIKQELACVTLPIWGQQSIEILVVKVCKGFTSGTKDGQSCIEHFGNILTCQLTLGEETIAVTSIDVRRDRSEKCEICNVGRCKRVIQTMKNTADRRTIGERQTKIGMVSI